MDTEKAKKIIEDMFNLVGISTESVDYRLDEKRGHIFSIKSTEFEKVSKEKEDFSRDLIYLLKRIFNKNTADEEVFKCTIDINDLQSKLDDKVKAMALEAATKARETKSDVLMGAMSSYERMLVHSALADEVDVETESVGEARDRRLKVKFISNSNSKE